MGILFSGWSLLFLAVIFSLIFSEKLKKKLELSGNDCSVEDIQQHASYASYDSNHLETGVGDESYTSDTPYNEPILKSTSTTKVKKERSASKTKPPKMRQKKSRNEDEDNGSLHDSDGGDGNGSLMKRRRKTELQISVSVIFSDAPNNIFLYLG
jgi:hypothetical protein